MLTLYVDRPGSKFSLQEGVHSLVELSEVLDGVPISKLSLDPYTSTEVYRGNTMVFSSKTDSEPVTHKVRFVVTKDAHIIVMKNSSAPLSPSTPSKQVEQPVSESSDDYDYIIVGMGAAGSILARKLSDDMQTKVLVIEAGSQHQADPTILNPDWISNASTLLLNPKYGTTYPVASSTNPFGNYTYPTGRGWGGGSMTNFMISVRGTPRVYDSWAAASSNSAWLYSNMLPLMKSLEHFHPNPSSSGSTTQRGYAGPISITQNPPLTHTPLMDKIGETFNAPYVSDYNDPELGSVGMSCNQQFITPEPDSHRSYSGLEFVPIGTIVDANGNGLDGRKLRIISNARVLNFDTRSSGGKLKATSVKYVRTTGSSSCIEEAELGNKGILILCAGAVVTPRILMSSGVGPSTVLLGAGIPVKVNSPQVGKNLQNHYGSSAIVTGVADNLSQVYTSMATPDDGVRRMQLLNIPIAPGLVQVVPGLLAPKSRGGVTLVDSDPLVPPKLDIGIYSDGDETVPGSDLNYMVSFYKKIKTAAEAAGGIVISPSTAAYASDSGLAAFAKADANIALQGHNSGSCRMGTNINNGVVDGNLNVFGLSNVKIGDVSIAPSIADANTCSSAYYIALVLHKMLEENDS